MLQQSFATQRKSVERTVTAGRLRATSEIAGAPGKSTPLAHQWWQHILRGTEPTVACSGALRTVDLFSGVGGLSLGAAGAAKAVALNHIPLAAIDLDTQALAVYERNFGPTSLLPTSVTSLVDYHVYGRGETAEFAYAPEIIDARLKPVVGQVDLLLAGPPCQGHSNLNNHTRRDDPRNMLYVCTAAAVVALGASMAVIENVPDVLSDKTDVIGTVRKVLRDSGYFVSDGVMNAAELGGAQTRKRHFLVATKGRHLELALAAQALAQPAMTLREAIGDLEDIEQRTFMDETPMITSENQARIDYLFAHGLFDLPNDIRPDCHKNGHTYGSVYGRLNWDKPAQTITTGFMTIGRGRYIHPSKKRVITAREAARIQGFPDSFTFSEEGEAPARRSLGKWIGDAVPTWLGYAAALTALSAR